MLRDYVFTWWQMGLIKICLLLLGIVIGITWTKVFKKKVIRWMIWTLLVVTTAYLIAIVYS